MFDFDEFMAGRQGIVMYTIHDFEMFCRWASRHNLTWRNGADPVEEQQSLHNDGNSIQNPSGVRRYVPGRPNVYVIVNGHLSQRKRSFARNNNIEMFDFCRIPDDTFIDDEGFEAEIF